MPSNFAGAAVAADQVRAGGASQDAWTRKGNSIPGNTAPARQGSGTVTRKAATEAKDDDGWDNW